MLLTKVWEKYNYVILLFVAFLISFLLFTNTLAQHSEVNDQKMDQWDEINVVVEHHSID